MPCQAHIAQSAIFVNLTPNPNPLRSGRVRRLPAVRPVDPEHHAVPGADRGHHRKRDARDEHVRVRTPKPRRVPANGRRVRIRFLGKKSVPPAMAFLSDLLGALAFGSVFRCCIKVWFSAFFLVYLAVGISDARLDFE
jgi:hypothetical protein